LPEVTLHHHLTLTSALFHHRFHMVLWVVWVFSDLLIFFGRLAVAMSLVTFACSQPSLYNKQFVVVIVVICEHLSSPEH